MLFYFFIFSNVCLFRGTDTKSFTYVIPEKPGGDDMWAWGFTEISVPNVSTYEGRISNSTFPPLDTKIEDPCPVYNPPKPDFDAPGRRISEAKCLEYKWEIKTAAERKNKSNECHALLIQELLKQPDGRKKLPQSAVGGRDTYPGEFPHMGAIGWKAVAGTWEFKCGSSLISPQFVLTAAHCSRASPGDTSLVEPTPRIVRLNAKNIFYFVDKNSSPNDVNIVKIIVHPNYQSPKKYYDIALMKLEKEVGFTQLLQPACLWPNDDLSELGATATLTGWGVLKPGSLALSEELQAAVVDILDSKDCDKLLQNHCNRHWCMLEDHQLCAGKLSGGVDACQGDSGGPLQVKIPLPGVLTPYNLYYIIGVTSFGIGCAQANRPGVYTRVSSFIDWIETEVWP
ncbi:hypothetical protein K1T71_009130 [Dendrolimus kikuchii]|uniref:Uncharacterized protein n=1 Tax=Dendrolimus kikuchii TaxID=765133 RepID=A0ACC1CTH4_9NEOP|nr:hypothetical protein K1T71_009130 [Dendrolimus kikuchii]